MSCMKMVLMEILKGGVKYLNTVGGYLVNWKYLCNNKLFLFFYYEVSVFFTIWKISVCDFINIFLIYRRSQRWKILYIKPIFKADAAKNNVENNRGIAILITLKKHF